MIVEFFACFHVDFLDSQRSSINHSLKGILLKACSLTPQLLQTCLMFTLVTHWKYLAAQVKQVYVYFPLL